MIKTAKELRQQLIDVLQNEIVPGLKFRKYGYQYPFEFVTLNSRDVCTMVTDQHTSTDLFGKLVRDFRNEVVNRKELDLFESFYSVFWWPAVDKVWPLQCFHVPASGDDGKNDRNDIVDILYLLARTAPDEWIGVKTFINYTN